MPRQQPNRVAKILPLFTTLFIVCGVAGIILTAPKQKTTETIVLPATATSTVNAPAVIIAETEGGVQVMAADGTRKTCAPLWGGGSIARVTADGMVVTTNGRSLLVSGDCTVKDTTFPLGLLSPNVSHGARLGDQKSDAASLIIFSDGKNEQEVTLRGTTARPYHDAHIVGWMDDGHVAVTAFQGDALYAMSVATTGDVVPLLALPEGADGFAAGDGAFWYVTVTPGAGIELPSRGPSAIHRIGLDKKDVVVAEDASSAIDGLLTGTSGRFAYTVGGTLFLTQGSDARNIGTGQPLGWTDAGSLLAGRNGMLLLIGPLTTSGSSASTTETGIALPEAVSRVWYPSQDAP